MSELDDLFLREFDEPITCEECGLEYIPITANGSLCPHCHPEA